MFSLLLFLTSPFSCLAHPAQHPLPLSSDHHSPTPFPSSYDLFSSSFAQPTPPLVHAEFKANFQQHAWSPSFSHISSGLLYNSPTHGKVRADATYDSAIVSSLFDYSHVNAENLIWNTLYTIEPSVATAPTIWKGFVKPAWALFEKDILVKSNAVFAGVINDRWLGEVATWKILHNKIDPVTVYLDTSATVMGYDFYDVSTRTGIVTRFFDIQVGAVDGRVFDFPEEA